MKFCFLDESGLHDEADALVVVGVIIDGYRLRSAEAELRGMFANIREQTGVVGEIKANQVYRGKGTWQGVGLAARRNVIRDICAWPAAGSHALALGSVRKEAVYESPLDPGYSDWMHASSHILLQVQRAHQPLPQNKGNTVFIFDEQVMNSSAMQALVADPPEWFIDYPGLDAAEPLSQVVATPFWVSSEVVEFIQVADVYAYVLRRHSEIVDGGSAERFEGEPGFIQECVEMLSGRFLAASARRPTRNATATSEWFRQAAPASLAIL